MKNNWSVFSWVTVSIILLLACGCGGSVYKWEGKETALNSESVKYSNQAAELFKRDQLNLALEACNKAILADSRNAQAFYLRGEIYAHAFYLHRENKDKGQLDLALADFNQALQLHPESKRMYGQRALVYMAKDQNDLALTDLNQSIRLDPKYPVAYCNRGVIYHKKKQYDKAIADYTKAIALNPRFGAAYGNRADTYLNLDKNTDALNDINQALSLDPKVEQFYATRFQVLVKLKRYKQALRDMEMMQKLGTEVDPKALKEIKEAAANEK